jgi:predicted secreted hydrolase
MNKYLLWVSFCLLCSGCEPEIPLTDRPVLSVTQTLGEQKTEGYTKALDSRAFIFPEDHGAHQDFKNEWWYFTGNLSSITGQQFGYQFTLFRTAISPEISDSESPWNSNQVYLAHIALSDISNGRFYFDEQFSRPALNIAGVQYSPFKLWIGDWQIQEIRVDDTGIFHLQLEAQHDDFNLSIELQNSQPVVLHGKQGLSAKSPVPGNASYYYSYPRLSTHGVLELNGQSIELSGDSWFDHEWSTSSLEKNQTGWDWFSLQFDDGREIMLFQLRDRNNKADNYLYGSYINRAGVLETLGQDGFSVKVIDQWQSPVTGVTYPAGWKIHIIKEKLDFFVLPKMKNQEMNTSFRYWEGAVRITDAISAGEILGQGYVELAGYQ